MKKLAILFVAFFLLTSLAAANLSAPDFSLTIDRGASGSDSRTVTNTENDAITVDFSATTLSNGGDTLGATLNPTQLNLAALAGDSVEVSVSVPNNQNPGTYSGTFDWEYSLNGSDFSGSSTITVNVVNQAPTITAIPDQTATVGVPFSYQVQANDAEGDSLTYTLSGEPAGMTISSSGFINGYIPTGAATNTITVSVTDGFDTSTETFVLTSQNDVPGLDISVSSVLFGGSSQERGEQVVETANIVNTGTQTINNLVASVQSNSGGTINADYNAQVTLNKNTLNPGEVAIATITLTVPVDQDSRESTVGRLFVSGDGNSQQATDTATLRMQARSYLKIDKVEIEIDGDDDNIDDGDTYDDIEEGDEVTLRVTLENLYSNSDDIEIENAYFEIEAEDSDWDNIDEESDEEDIKEDSDEELEIKFTIDDDIDEDTTDVVIRAYGDDGDDDFEHYDEITFTFEIDRERDEIRILNWEFDKSRYTCDDDFARLNVEIKNTGTDDQDEVTLQVVADELDWNKRLRDLELDEDDKEDYDFEIDIRGAKAGDYFVDIETYHDNDDESDDDVADFTIVCTDEDDEDSSRPTVPTTSTRPSVPISFPTEVVVVGDEQANANNGNAVYGEPIGVADDFRNSNLYLVLLIALIFFAIVGVILLGANLMKK